MSTPPLYGHPRSKPPPKKPIHLSSTSIHALSTELALARSRLDSTANSSNNKSHPAKSRPNKTKSLFASAKANKGVQSRAAKDVYDVQGGGGKTSEELGGGTGPSERELDRSRKRLKEKARIYKRLERGEEMGGVGDEEGLVDFDRKWVEDGGFSRDHHHHHRRHSDEEEEEEEEEEEGGDEVVEYIDEFGRTRKAKKSLVEKEKRLQERTKQLLQDEEDMKRPMAPEGLIYGDTIQSNAFFTPEFTALPSAEKLDAAIGNGDTGVEEEHYDASKEVRTKGVGFYQFSKDEKERKEEMEALEAERKRTEEERAAKEEKRKRKREMVEKRKEEVRKRRRGKVGQAWLEGLMGEIAGEEKGGDGGTGG